MLKLFGTCAAIAVLASFGGASAAPQATSPEMSHYGSWGLDLAARDPSVRPGDDFFEFANGAYQARLVIPSDRPTYGPNDELVALTESQLHGILDAAAAGAAPPSTLEGKVGAFYASYMDTARLDGLGAAPLAPELAAIRGATSREALCALMGRQNASFFGSIFTVSIGVDAKVPTRYAVTVAQAGLGLPDRDYYLDPKLSETLAQYQSYLAELLRLSGWRDPADSAKKVVAFEARIAQASWTAADQRDATKTYNVKSVSELEQIAPGFAWRAFFKAAGLDVDQVVASELTAIPKIAEIFATTPVETLQAWHAARLADNAAFYMAAPFADARFNMREKVLLGQAEQGERWRRGIRAVGGGHYFSPDRTDRFGNMGWGVGQLYTAKYFTPDTKKKMEALAQELLAAFRARIVKSQWMSPATKGEALRKLAVFRIKVGYPDIPRDYSELRILKDDLYGNVERAAADDWRFHVSRLSRPVDRDEWLLTPQTIDAYASPLNDLVFPSAFLQPPYFDPNADAAVNYGSAGAIIAHELTHGFDDQGRHFDAEGRIRDWWAPQDDKKFTALAAKLGAQFASYEPLPGFHINPELTMGENIADLGGLTVALEAYHASLNGKPAPIIDGFSGDQRLLLSWAQVWRGKDRDDFLRMRLTSNPHSPNKYRVNGIVRNLPDWYRAFHVDLKNKLYLNAEDRVEIW